VGTTSEIFTREEIRSIYESGPEEVIALVKRLQSEIIALNERVAKLETRVTFDNFLLYLDSDRESAGKRYSRLQQALISFFSWRNSLDPESRAAETLDILSKQISEGRQIDNVETYSIGVARKVLLKEHDSREANHVSLDAIQPDYDLRLSVQSKQTLADHEVNQRLYDECMRSCLQQLPESDRLLISMYAAACGHDKDNRENLAREAGISLQVLRVRINRIRGVLRECLRKCLKKGSSL
jgi:DNA-directed RNA polymerase specialized sigma24 family protein